VRKREREKEREIEKDRNTKNGNVRKLESNYQEMIAREQRIEKTIKQEGKRTRKQ